MVAAVILAILRSIPGVRGQREDAGSVEQTGHALAGAPGMIYVFSHLVCVSHMRLSSG